ncbi:permease prefix domain 1-containing protein [Actinoplanes sp. NPDC049118]|uniref:permease prefix domain 1-containing protein n=1 Tax=Actinoplanes sp. NPDC049118 TaxID=3155769 RepID=UPI0033FB0F79
MTSLSDRYVDTTLRRLPPRQRTDIERELRAAIADAVDDRLAAGADAGEAEVAVLTELGDPARLAAGYADRPLHLIGPGLYLDYTRLLTILLATVVPAVAAAVGFVRGVQESPVLTVIGDTLGAAVTTAVHIAVWTTVLFAVIERTPALRRFPDRTWTPDALPDPPPSRRARWGELVAESVALVLVSTLVLLAPVVSPETDAAGEPVNVLNPWLWETGFVYVFIALAVAALAFSFARYYVRWSLPLAVAGALVNVASAVTLIWAAATDRILNPAFTTAAGWPPDAAKWINVGLIVVAIGTLVHTVTESFGQARRR